MKKLICMMLALTLCLGLCACGGSGAPEMPTEPENWAISPQYVAGKVAEFMATEDYQKMAADFEKSFHDVTQKLIVRRPYVDAAVELYIKDPECHLLILLVRGDFGWEDSYDFQPKIVYDMDTGVFYDSLVHQLPDAPQRYADIVGKPHEQLLHRPTEVYTTAFGSEPLYTQYEICRALSAEELAAVNKALGVEEPAEGILYEPLPTEAPETEPPAEVPVTESPTEAPVEAPKVEEPADAPAEEPDVSVDAQAPQTVPSGEVTVSEQFVIDAVRSFQSSQQYQDVATDPGNIRISAAFEYVLSNFEKHNVHVLVVRVEGVDTDTWGFSSDTFLVDISSSNIYHNGNLDLNNWGGFAAIEEAFAAIICSSVWENQMIWSDMETRTDLPQSMLDAINTALS